MVTRCFICEKVITVAQGRGWRNWVCQGCASEHGLTVPLGEWPDWARAFVNHERTERRREAQRVASGVEFVSLDAMEELGQSAGE